jgi:hypothetical protein
VPLKICQSSASLCSQNSAGPPQICATFQRDILRRHFRVRILPPQPRSPVSVGRKSLASDSWSSHARRFCNSSPSRAMSMAKAKAMMAVFADRCSRGHTTTYCPHQGSPVSVWLHSNVQCSDASQTFSNRRISARSLSVQAISDATARLPKGLGLRACINQRK